MTISQPNNAQIVNEITQRLNAIKEYLPAKTTIDVNGTSDTLAQVTAIYQACLDTRAALLTAQATVKAALVARQNADVPRKALDKALRAYVVNKFGADSQAAHDFGFLPPKVATKTVAVKAQAVADAKATRKARNTMGKNQKKGIKGVVPSTAPAAPATNAQTASSSAAGATTTNGVSPAASSNGAAAHP